LGWRVKTVRKAYALVVRERELLQLLHPEAGSQLPKGGIDDGEAPRAAALRELHEESGLKDVAIVHELGVYSLVTPGGPLGDGPLERQDWYLFAMTPTDELPDSWTHTVQGDGIDRGMQYGYRWIPLDADAPGKFEPYFRPAVERLLAL